MAFPAQTLANNFANWNVTYSIYSGMTGKVTLTNQEQQYTTGANRWIPIRINLTNTVTSDLADDSCLAGNVNWINGIILSGGDSRRIEEDMFTVNVGSYFTTLRGKPVNTHYYIDTPSTILADVLSVYCGIPAALIDLTGMAAAPTIRGVVQGNDVYAECAKLAQVAQSDLFVQVAGTLTAEAWADDDSSVDFVLPNETIISAVLQRSREKGPSRITVRGRWQGSYGCGTKMLNNAVSGPPDSIKRDHCYKNGLGETRSTLTFKNLAGDKQAIRNAGFIFNGDQEFSKLTDVPEGGSTAVIDALPDGGGYLPPATLSQTSAVILARTGDGQETDDPGTKSQVNDDRLSQHDHVIAAMTGTPPGAFSVNNTDADKTGDARDGNRLEMIVQDSDLAAEFGVSSEEIDNPYVSDQYTAFVLAVRKFKEFKMQRNTYKVSVAYMPCIEINNVVTFTTPDGDKTVTGRVANIVVGYTPSPIKVTMTLTVESFEELGSTAYATGNLMYYPNLCGINGIHWVLHSGSAYAINGYLAFEPGGVIRQTLFLLPGTLHTLGFDVIENLTGSFVVRHYNGAVLGGTSSAITATGTVSYTFTPTSSSVTLEFAASSGEWFFTKPWLSMSITA